MGLFIWGVYAVFAHESPTAVSEETSHAAYTLWLTWHIAAPPILWVGQLTPNQRVQWWLRWAGDSALFVMIMTHVGALHAQIRDQVLGASTYLLFIPVLLAVAALCLSTRDLIKAVSASKGCDTQ